MLPSPSHLPEIMNAVLLTVEYRILHDGYLYIAP